VSSSVGVSELPVERMRRRALGTSATADLDDSASCGLGETFGLSDKCSANSFAAMGLVNDQRGDSSEGTLNEQRGDAHRDQSEVLVLLGCEENVVGAGLAEPGKTLRELGDRYGVAQLIQECGHCLSF